MALIDRIEEDLLVAQKKREELTRDTLRLLKNSIKNVQINEQKETLTDEDVVTVIGREVKKRKESIEAYATAGKPELVSSEQAELEILSKYLPAQLSQDEVAKIVSDYFETHKNETLQIGQVIGALSPQLKGKVDMGFVSSLIKEKLSQ